MELILFKCPACEKQSDVISLQKHCVRAHKISSEDLYVTLFLNGIKPKCLCGCGVTPKYHRLGYGYSKFLPNHSIRVHNNWGHNPKALAKSHATCRIKRANGEMPAWSKGLTKETDIRLQATSETNRKTWTPEKREKYSVWMKEWRLDGTVPTLSGSAHSQWKGGVAELHNLCRSYLNKVWTFPKLRAVNYQCSRCSSIGGELNVHHDGERFADIMHKIANQFNWTGDNSDYEKKAQIAEAVSHYHINNNISGVVLCHPCHVKVHEELGEHIN